MKYECILCDTIVEVSDPSELECPNCHGVDTPGFFDEVG